MKRKTISRIMVVVSLVLCTTTVFSYVVFATETRDDTVFIDEITISPRHGIVEGTTSQLTATLSPQNASSTLVEWSSSNENVVSCTKEGVIKGVAANGYADITCKAKFGKGKDTVRIYCAESIGGYYRDNLNKLFVSVYHHPEKSLSSTLYFNYSMIWDNVFAMIKKTLSAFPTLVSSLSEINEISFGPCEVRGRYGKYAYVVVATESGGVR